nr:hypothetical protein [Fretibacterium sp.]
MKKRLGFAVAAVCAAALVACGGLPAAAEVFEKSWDSEVVEHKGFRDLGHYVIELPDYTDLSLHEKGFAAHNELFDNGLLPKGGCTAMAKHNSRGEVIMGRNMDL